MRIRLYRRPGFALATTFIVAFVVLLAGFTMAGIASFNYNLAKRAQLRDEAFDGASAGLSYAMQQLMHDSAWGSNQPPSSRLGDTLPQTTMAGSSDPVSFYVTFADPTNHLGYPANLPWSVNNLNGSAPVNGPVDPADGQPHEVPPGFALIFAEGVAGQGSMAQVRILEALLKAPSYQFAISANKAVASFYCGPLLTRKPHCPLTYYETCPQRGTLVDSATPCGFGSILVRPLAAPCPPWSRPIPWCGGLPAGCGACCPPGLQAPYAVYLPNGSVVTGNVIAGGRACAPCCPATNVQPTACPDVSNWHACSPPVATTVQVARPCAPKGETLPDIRPLANPMVQHYICPKTYCCKYVTMKFQTVVNGCAKHGPWICAKVYGCFDLPPCEKPCCTGTGTCPIQVKSDTLVVFNPTCPPPVIKLGTTKHYVQFVSDYTLTIQNAYARIEGGLTNPQCVNCKTRCSSFCTSATLLFLPQPINSAVGPPACVCAYSAIKLCGARGGGWCAGSGNHKLSVLSVGNLVLGNPISQSDTGVGKPPCCRCCCQCCKCYRCCKKFYRPCGTCWSLNGVLATIGGSLTFFYGKAQVKGILLAEDPWNVRACGQTGNFGVVYVPRGTHVSYCPTAARSSWIGQAVTPEQTRDGLSVVYWRDIQPGF